MHNYFCKCWLIFNIRVETAPIRLANLSDCTPVQSLFKSCSRRLSKVSKSLDTLALTKFFEDKFSDRIASTLLSSSCCVSPNTGVDKFETTIYNINILA